MSTKKVKKKESNKKGKKKESKRKHRGPSCSDDPDLTDQFVAVELADPESLVGLRFS